ncbi:MAG: hypothetical protein ACRDLA_06510, partial [Thermoleophilaceae bacterium]
MIAVALIGVVAAAVAAASGIVLADIYRPSAPGASISDLPPGARRSVRWTDWHRGASGVLVVAAALSLVLLVALHYRGRTSMIRKPLVVASIVAVVVGVVTVITRPLVEWDQLGLWSVTVGAGVDGYWFAGFGEDVRFLVVGSSEVSQAEYVPALIAHLIAPMLGAVSLLFLVAALARAQAEPPAGEGCGHGLKRSRSPEIPRVTVVRGQAAILAGGGDLRCFRTPHDARMMRMPFAPHPAEPQPAVPGVVAAVLDPVLIPLGSARGQASAAHGHGQVLFFSDPDIAAGCPGRPRWWGMAVIATPRGRTGREPDAWTRAISHCG